MRKSYKYLIGISFSLVVLLLCLETDFLIERETIYWDANTSITWSNFRGYPVFFSEYGAAISSSFNYELDTDSLNSIKVKTFMYPHHSWVLPTEKESEEGLQHEQYHFNISEVISRKFREAILKMPRESIDKEVIKRVYRQYLTELNTIQDKYDTETDHSLKRERQKDWEYLIDSMLVELEYYKLPMPFQQQDVYAKSKYYRKLEVNAYDQITGKYPIDSSVAQHSKYYRVYYKNDTIIKVEHWNRNKLESDELFGSPVIKVERNKNQELWLFYDKQGNPENNNRNIHLVKCILSDKQIEKTYYDKSYKPVEDKEGIHKVIWELDYKKRKSLCKHFNLSGNQVSDDDGFYIVSNRYDSSDNIIEQANYNSGKELTSLKDGAAYYRYVYDQFNNVIAYKSYDVNHNLHNFEGNKASGHFKYDLDGNIICSLFRDTEGKIVGDDDGGAISYYRYDKYANVVDEKHYGCNKNLFISEERVGRLLTKYDSLGRAIEQKNMDAYDKLLNDKHGVCLKKFTYNELNLIVKSEQYAADSSYNPKFLKAEVYIHNDKYKITKKYYVDLNNKPIADTAGIAEIRYKYDKGSNLIQVDYYDIDRKPVSFDKSGVASIRYKYDENNKIESSYFDINMNLKGTNNSIAIDKYTYNKKNQLIERRYYNAKNELVKNDMGVETIRWELDNRNNIIEETYYDKNQQLTPDKNGVATYKYTYNDKDQLTKTFCYNDKNRLVTDQNDGVAEIVNRYSDNGNLIRTSYYNKDNNLINLPEGYAIEEHRYKGNKKVKTMYFSDYKVPVVTSMGYATIEWLYDMNENVIAEIYLDENDRYIEDKDGFAIYNWIYNRNGDVVKSYGFDANRQSLKDLYFGDFIETIDNFYANTGYPSGKNENIRYQATYYDNGQLESEILYVDGKPEGTYKSYYETGELKSTIEYKNGAMNGKCIEYYKDGNISREMMYEDNMLISETEKSWYESGEIRSKYVDGEQVYWDNNGNIISD